MSFGKGLTTSSSFRHKQAGRFCFS